LPLLSSRSPHLPLSHTSSLSQLCGSEDDDVPPHAPPPPPTAVDGGATANSNDGTNGNNGDTDTISSPHSCHRCRHRPPASLCLPHSHSRSFAAVTTTSSLPTIPAPRQQPSTSLQRQTATTDRSAIGHSGCRRRHRIVYDDEVGKKGSPFRLLPPPSPTCAIASPPAFMISPPSPLPLRRTQRRHHLR
jgi:hypothetical protein